MQKNNVKKIKIIVTGGGTGGHFVPLLVVVEELMKENPDILFIGSGNQIEKEMSRKLSISYKSVMSGKYRRYFSWQNFFDFFKIIIGFFQSLVLIIFFRPRVIFAKGGYVTLPVVFAGWLLGVPIVTHESDVIMGLANRFEAKFARKVCVGFPIENYSDISLKKIIYTGNPVRKEFFNKIESNKEGGKLIILVIGGSQGSRFINQTIATLLNYLTIKYYVIHISGKNDYEWLKKNRWNNYELYDFTDQIPKLMKKADIVISRAGANTLAEISALGKPSILIPLPSAANNHQWANAKVYEKENAAVVLSEKNLTPDNFRSIIDNLLGDKKLLSDISRKSLELSQQNADSVIAEEIFKVVNK